jgi:chromosome segregation protein
LHFQKLRLSGFKSFVEPVEFRIESGLTGIVGPNGCGKSNLLEALRWVMGANSAKAMRADGMDDVIFGGSGARPPRNHAEVSLQIDNADYTAPPRFNDHAVLEVTRRITRGAGSIYRINGMETRAKDVQLLFADASTGANSPSLVRQGQISELIGAKPSNRRRILEEAAGVSGLHARRHEAGLRLNAAEVNLARLDDVAQEIESGLNRLRRDARQADKYKRLSAEIRTLQSAALHARWAEAQAGMAAAQSDLAEAVKRVEQTARTAAQTTEAALAAAQALDPLRQETMVAAAVLQRLAIERDRLERDGELAKAQAARLDSDLKRNTADQDREAQIASDAEAALQRLAAELADVERAMASAPSRLPVLEQAHAEAQVRRADAEAKMEQIAGEAAAEAARRLATQAASRAALDHAQLAYRAAAARSVETKLRLDRVRQAMQTAAAERAALPDARPNAERAARTLADALTDLQAARDTLERSEAERAAAAQDEVVARQAARRLDDDLRRLKSEADGLMQVAASTPAGPSTRPYRAALDQITPEPGYEAAVAAAFGDDLDAALDVKLGADAPAFWAPDFWAHGQATLPAWPEGATPLAAVVAGPEPLAGRLAMTAIVARGDGERLQTALPVGGRLVSKAGDLWRWDGYTERAGAPRAAAKRLAQKARLIDIAAKIDALAPGAQAALDAHRAAEARARRADETVRTARKAPEAAERAVASARDTVERLARDQTKLEARAQALDESLDRLRVEAAEAEPAWTRAVLEDQAAQAAVTQAVSEATTSGADAPDVAATAAALTRGRQDLATAREAETRARANLDAEARAADGRLRRREGLSRDQDGWTKRAVATTARLEALEAERAVIVQALAQARPRPHDLAEKLAVFLSTFNAAQTRQTQSADDLRQAETTLGERDRAARAADQAASSAREDRAAADARLEGAETRRLAAANAVREATRLEPEALAGRIAQEAVAIPKDPAAVEGHLRALEREREALGPVNLRAEEELQDRTGRLQTLLAERADLAGAISKLRDAVNALNAEGRDRLLAAFTVINTSFKSLFETLFEGGEADLRLAESDDPLEAGLEIYACPHGKRLAALSLMSGGEQALTATALILAVFLSNPAPVCVLDEVDAPLDDANVDRFCRLLDEMRRRTDTRFIAITHNPVTMSRMDRLYGVTMAERGVSQLVSVDLRQASAMVDA